MYMQILHFYSQCTQIMRVKEKGMRKKMFYTHTHVINMSVCVCVLYITPAIVLSGVDCFSKKHKMCKILIQFIIIFSLCLAVIFHPQNM